MHHDGGVNTRSARRGPAPELPGQASPGQAKRGPLKSAISLETVRHVAELARLELTEEELATHAAHLAAIVGYVGRLAPLDVDGVESTAHAMDLRCPFREDEIRPSTQREQILKPAPDQDGEHFIVPRIIDTADG